MKKVLALISAALFLGLFSSITAAQEKDVAGSKDHPLMSRVTGYYIGSYKTEQLGVPNFETSTNVNCEKPCTHPAIKGGQLVVEGKVTAINYVLQRGAAYPGQLSLLRNYEKAVAQLGGTKISNGGVKGGEVDGIHVWAIPSVKGDPKSPSVIFAFMNWGSTGYRVSNCLEIKLILAGCERTWAPTFDRA